MTDLEQALAIYDGDGKMPYCDLVWQALKEKRENQWIPVGERLPECKKYGEVEVLVCMDDGFIATATFVKGDGFELWAEAGEVVYWMPLPQPPEETK